MPGGGCRPRQGPWAPDPVNIPIQKAEGFRGRFGFSGRDVESPKTLNPAPNEGWSRLRERM